MSRLVQALVRTLWQDPARLWPPPGRVTSPLLTGCLVFGLMAACFLLIDIRREVLRALPALPAAALVHAVQIAATAMGWRCLFHMPRPGILLMFRARWVRESLNGLLPLVGIGGGVLAGLAVARQTRRPVTGVAAGATVDLLVESVMQLPFLLLGLVLFARLAPGALPVAEAGMLILPLLLTALLALALRLGLGREPALRLTRRMGLWSRLMSLQESLAVVNADMVPMLQSASWHFLAWMLGAAEVWVIFAVLGTPVGLLESLAVESLGMAARSLGFVLPAGLGAQEAGLTAVAVALGAPLEQAVAMSMLKRLREVLMNLPGLIAWQWWARQPSPHSTH